MFRFALFLFCLFAATIAQDTDGDGNCNAILDFECTDNRCIPLTALCDGVQDCHNGIDESAFVNCDVERFLCLGAGTATNEWCDQNCNNNPPNCPANLCTCRRGLRPTSLPDSMHCLSRGVGGVTDEWCNLNCNSNPSFCPEENCVCGADAAVRAQPARLCQAVAGTSATAEWCTSSCNNNPSFCPAELCSCTEITDSLRFFRSLKPSISDSWCEANCLNTPPFCPEDTCERIN
eukprot:c17033_g1_i3.p1 GENE.c17033_g1_i3~~c17033_g1_i3.p1  ORF type:complete len:249 (+),score=38.03 c17033_g1_i3:46-747(+)